MKKMAEERRVSKYDKVRDGLPESDLLPVGSRRGLLGVACNISVNKETKIMDNNIALRVGFKGDMGFIPNRLNSSLDLPYDLTDDQLDSLIESIRSMRDFLVGYFPK